MKLKQILFYTALYISLSNGCIKKADFPVGLADIETTTGIPIVYSEVTAADLVAKKDTNFHIVIDSGYYKMIFGPDTSKFPTAADLIQLQDRYSIGTFQIPISSALSPNSISASIPYNSTDNVATLNNAKIRNIYFTNGSLSITLNSDLNEVNVTLTCLNINNSSGTPLSLIYRINNSSQTKIASLQGYHANFGNSLGTRADLINFRIDLEIGQIGQTGTLNASNINLTNLTWSRIEGKLGSVVVPLISKAQINVSEGIPISPFSNNINNDDSTHVYFVDPSLNFNISNSFGLPSTISIDPIQAINKYNIVTRTDSVNYNLNYPVNDPGLNAPASLITTSGILAKSNLSRVLENAPKKIQYGVNLVIDSNKTSYNDYILYDSKIFTTALLELPLYGYLNNFRFLSDVDYTFSDSASSNINSSFADVSLRSGIFKIWYSNGIPFQINLQAYFIDGTGKSIYTIFPGKGIIIEAATVDPSTGVVVTPGMPLNNLSIPSDTISQSTFNMIKSVTKKIRFTASINSSNVNTANLPSSTKIKVFPNNKLTLQMTIDGDVNIKFNH